MNHAALAALAAALAATACAPEVWTPAKAGGFDAFLDQIAAECQPLYAGPLLVTRELRDASWDLQAYRDYEPWLDQTSRLYYKRISPQAYLDNIGNLLGPRSAESARCTVSKLPADAPAGLR